MEFLRREKSISDSSLFEHHHQKITQFVYNVHHFSSQYGREDSKSYAAINLISSPSVYPNYGDFMESCVMVKHIFNIIYIWAFLTFNLKQKRTYGPWWSTINFKSSLKEPLFISQDFIGKKK